jgi:hypothetical protein
MGFVVGLVGLVTKSTQSTFMSAACSNVGKIAMMKRIAWVSDTIAGPMVASVLYMGMEWLALVRTPEQTHQQLAQVSALVQTPARQPKTLAARAQNPLLQVRPLARLLVALGLRRHGRVLVLLGMIPMTHGQGNGTLQSLSQELWLHLATSAMTNI